MATTLTLFIGIWPKIYLVQIGDSRYYLLREGVLTQVSRDQTIARDLIDQGSWPAHTRPVGQMYSRAPSVAPTLARS